MNVHEAMEIISAYIDMLYNQGVLADCEIIELQSAEQTIYTFLEAMEG